MDHSDRARRASPYLASLVLAAALAPLARSQEGGGEGAHVPRIGLYVASLPPMPRDPVAAAPRAPDAPATGFVFSLCGPDCAVNFDGARLTTRPLALPEGFASDGRECVGLALAQQPDGRRAPLIVDSAGHRIWRPSPTPGNSPPLHWGGRGAGPADLRDPRGIAALGDVVYVADCGNHRVQKFSLEGEPLVRVGSRGTGAGQFIRPTDVAVDGAGFVYVVDTGNHRVQKFDVELNFIKSWGAFGPHPGFFAFPEGIDCFEDRLYVVDTDNHRVQVFDLEGALLYEWGLHALAPREGEGKLHYPRDVAVARTPEGLVALVTEPFEDRFQLFRETRVGEELPLPTIPDRVIAAHFGPRLDIAEDLVAMFEPGAPSLLLYDIEHEVQPWEPIQVSRMAAWGRKIGQFRCPTDVAIDAARRLIYVADADSGVLASYRFAHTRQSPLEFNAFEFKLVRSLDFAEHRRLARPEREFEIQPAALELHASGDVYVLDSLQNAVFVFTPQFELARTLELANFAGEASLRLTDLALSADGKRLYVIDELGRALCIVELDASASPTGQRASLRGRPGGVAVSASGEVFVSDLEAHAIHRLDARGGLLATFGGPGIGRVQFHKPRGLDFDEQGRLWVVDWGNHRGQVLSIDGEFLAAFGSRLFTKPTR